MNRLQTTREAAEISVRELAAASNVSADTIMRAEHPDGRTRHASMTKIVDGLNTLLKSRESDIEPVTMRDVFPDADASNVHLGALERRGDAWATAWGDPTLQDLGRTLTRYGIGVDAAALAVERTWLFYSYVVIPAVRRRPPMGIATKAGGRPRACLFLPINHEAASDHPSAESPRVHIEDGFAREVAEPLAEWLELSLNVIERPGHGEAGPVDERGWLDGLLNRYTRTKALEYLGLFADDLIEELATVMDRRDVVRWLRTPNTLFAGRAPKESLDDPLDQRFRDVVLRAKFDLSAA